MASLLWGRWYHKYLLRGISVDLSGVSCSCTWGSGCDLFLSSNNSVGIGVFTLMTLHVCFSVLRWYVCRDDQDLAIYGFEFFSRIVRGDGCVGDLERKAVWR
jgi:hypothetical protein